MPLVLLTKRTIDRIPNPDKGQVFYWDKDLKGFGLLVGLQAKTFIIQCDVLDSATGKYKTVRAKLGRYGEITPKQARERAPDALQRIRVGRAITDEAIPTLRHLYQDYLKKHILAKTTLDSYEIHIKKFTGFLDLPLHKIETVLSSKVVLDLYSEVLNNNGYGAATNSFKHLQTILKYGMVAYPQYLTKNPISPITDAKLWVPHKERKDSIYSVPGQFKAFSEGLLHFSQDYQDALLLVLYQGIRPNEAQTIKWEEVDLERKIAHIHHETEKSKKSYIIPLCTQALLILKRRNESRSEGDKYVFSFDSKKGHIRIRASLLKQLTGLDLTIHGLRRTFIMTGETQRLRREDIDLLTGHADPSVVGRHYKGNIFFVIEDIRPTGQLIADEIERLLKGKSKDKVTTLHSK